MTPPTYPDFLIDISRCTGCNACSIACKDRLHLPDGVDCLVVEQTEEGVFPIPLLSYRVRHCLHCEKAPCVDACQTVALVQEGNGRVSLKMDLCSACGRCVSACPFAAIVLDAGNRIYKCDGCPEEVAAGRQPVCVRACPMRALDFGAKTSPPRPGLAPDERFDDRDAGPRVAYFCRALVR